MQNYSNNNIVGSNERANEGLSSFFQRVYGYMALAVAVTALTSYALSTIFLKQYINLLNSMGSLSWIIILVLQVAIVFVMGRQTFKNPGLAFGLMMLFAITEGIVLGSIFLMYTATSIASAFVITAVDFAAMALWGFFSKKSMAGWGPILFGATIALIVAGIINFFINSSALSFIYSIAAILIFSAWTAYDNNRLKAQYYQFEQNGITDLNGLALNGALSLYMDFINLFVNILRFVGVSRNN